MNKTSLYIVGLLILVTLLLSGCTGEPKSLETPVKDPNTSSVNHSVILNQPSGVNATGLYDAVDRSIEQFLNKSK